MKRSRFFKVLAAAVVLALLMLAMPITPALGVAAVTITYPVSANGPPGTAVSLSCSGFTSSTTYTVSFGGVAVSSGSTGTGTFAASFAVPTQARANYTVTVSTTPDGAVSLAGGFTITPEITLNVSTAHVGDTITVDGAGFEASDTVTIYYDTTNVGTDATGTSGTFDNFTFTVPTSTEGSHYVSGRDDWGYSPDVGLAISPKIIINPTSGSVGDTITVSGNGFDGSSDITIYFDSTTMTTADTNTSGTFPATTFTVPSTSRGSHTVKARDESLNEATATFTVSAKITLNPTSGPSGTTVTITGTGFGDSRTVTITYEGTTVTTTPSPLTTNTAGYFTATFKVPVGVAGIYEVAASDATNTAMADFESTTNATISQTTTTTAPGNVGMSLTITGVGFTPNATVTVTYATDPVVLATVTADPSGNFTATFVIPPSLAGSHVITVSDGTISKTFDFVMESNAPPTPGLTLPLADTKLEDNTFEWEAVEDVSPASNPVTYDLQVATTSTFSTASLLINESGLSAVTYTIPEEEELESTSEDAPYYWRVRAVDAASNASAWSAASAFTVGWSFEFTGWVVYVAIALAAVIFFFLGLWLGRRSGGGEYY